MKRSFKEKDPQTFKFYLTQFENLAFKLPASRFLVQTLCTWKILYQSDQYNSLELKR